MVSVCVRRPARRAASHGSWCFRTAFAPRSHQFRVPCATISTAADEAGEELRVSHLHSCPTRITARGSPRTAVLPVVSSEGALASGRRHPPVWPRQRLDVCQPLSQPDPLVTFSAETPETGALAPSGSVHSRAARHHCSRGQLCVARARCGGPRVAVLPPTPVWAKPLGAR